MKLWGSRFDKKTDEKAEGFMRSLSFDVRLYPYEVKASIAHAKMLAKCKVISQAEAKKIALALKEIYKEIKENKFKFLPTDEDIHTAIERALVKKIGDTGKKIHTARSRNDQVVTILRMYLKDEIKEIGKLIVGLQKVLIKLAEGNLEVIMPSYTHLQQAQPVLFSHYLMAYFFMFERDFVRFKNCYEECDSLPLGSGAGAGVNYLIDREYVARELGFSKISFNSLDAVSDRDFVVDFLSAASLLMVHLSRLCEEIILWQTAEFNFIELDDAYTTGSSIMPHKKNPDVAELIRGKSGRVFGHLQAILTTLKGLPLAYNRDLQEDKEGFFDAVDTIKPALKLTSKMLATAKVNAQKIKEGVSEFTLAVDISDYLVKKGLSFREAHNLTGKIVKSCLEKNLGFSNLKLSDWRKFSPLFEEDVFDVIKLERSVASKKSAGGTAPERVNEEIKAGRKIIEKETQWFKK